MATNGDDTSARSRSEVNAWLVEEMHERFRTDPASLPPEWRDFFPGYVTGPRPSSPPRIASAALAEVAPGDRAPADGAANGAANGAAARGATADGGAHDATKGTANGATKGTASGATNGAARSPASPAAPPPAAEGAQRLRGAGARIAANMTASLGVPTATSVRDVPAKLLEVNRRIANNYLARARGGKVSFTHLIAYALVRALSDVPAMLRVHAEVDG